MILIGVSGAKNASIVPVPEVVSVVLEVLVDSVVPPVVFQKQNWYSEFGVAVIAVGVEVYSPDWRLSDPAEVSLEVIATWYPDVTKFAVITAPASAIWTVVEGAEASLKYTFP